MRTSIQFRLLDTGENNAAMNMAIDEAILLGGAPTLRFYLWRPPAITIGYFQGIEQEVDLGNCRKLGVDVVRRITGGGAVYHDAELTYSLLAPQRAGFSRDIKESYRQTCRFIVDGLKELGLGAEFHPINDILVNGRKISGNAQTRRNRMILQHGTVLLDADTRRMFSLLKVPSEKMRDKLVRDAKDRVTSVRREAGGNIGFHEVRDALISAFVRGTESFALSPGELTASELKTARSLAGRKYSTRKWNFMR